MIGEIHWREGLFLQPHHLQTLQHTFQDRLAADRRLAWSYPYGLVESKLSPDALENLIVQFERLRAVMPSGLTVDAPETADLPSLDIKKAFESGRGSFMVYLGVPLWYAERANAVEAGGDTRVKRIYRVSEIERPDENTGENSQPMQVRRVNARLLLDDEDRSDLEVLPVLKIVRSAGEQVGLPRQDPSFIPPCLVLGGSPILRELMRDLANQVEASRKELVIQITRGGFRVENMRGIQFEQMLRLQTLGRFSARLSHQVQTTAVTPSDLYVELRDLLGELAALYPDRDRFDAAAYDHDNLALTFQGLMATIRSLLRGAVAPSYLQAPFRPEGNLFVLELTEEHLTRPNAYFLGIRTKEDPVALAKLVEDPDRYKVMAKSLATRAIRGIKVSLERIPPLELPSETGLTYFRLQTGESARMWEEIKREKVVGLCWPGMESADHRTALYMTVPRGEEGA